MRDPIAVIDAMPEDRWIAYSLAEKRGRRMCCCVVGWLLHEAGVHYRDLAPEPPSDSDLYGLLADHYGLHYWTVGELYAINDGSSNGREAKDRTVSHLLGMAALAKLREIAARSTVSRTNRSST